MPPGAELLLERLHDAARRLARIQSETSVRQTIADTGARLFEAPGTALFVLEGGTPVLAATAGECATLPPGLRLPSSAVATWAAAAGTPATIAGPEAAPEALREQWPALVVPLSGGDGLVGLLWVRLAGPGATVAPLAARIFAIQAAGALDNARRYREAAEAARRKDGDLATLAHELRNPLGAILNTLEVLERFAASDTQVVRLRQLIGRQTRHLARLVEDVLDVARLRHDKVRLHRERVDLRDIVRQALDSLRAAGRTRDHELRPHLPGGPVVVHGDATRLEQVVRNLLDNAVKYSPPRTAIDVSVERTDGAAVLGVRDQGIGITPAMLPRLFEPFAQGDRARPLAAGGLGLGLPLVRAIVEQHGGTITAQSGGPGQGSVFVVRLPLPRPSDGA